MRIRWHGMLGTQHSWAFTQQHLIRAMKEIGDHEIFLRSTNNLEHFPDDLREFLVPGYHGSLTQGPADFIDEQGNQIKIDPKSPLPEIPDKNAPYDLELAYTIFYQAPRRFFPHSKARGLIWNFESSILPPGWQEYHRALDYIFPSSQYSYDIFANNGIPREKMLVVPHGVDTNMFNPDIPPFKLKTEKRVKFLHNAIPHHRKLHERVIKAYLDAFTGDDDVCLVLKTKFLTPAKDKPFEVDVREILNKAFKGRKNPPEIEIVNAYVPDIGALYTASDAIISMSSCEGFCVLPNTPIDLEHKSIPIDSVKEGDLVRTHCGNLQKVLKTTKRFVNEELIEIRRHGCYSWFVGTKEHPHLVVKRNGKRFSTLRKQVSNGTLAAQWVGLGNIEKGDFVVIAKPKITSDFSHSIDILNFINDLNPITDGKFVWLNNSFDKRTGTSSLKKVADEVGCTFQHVSRVINKKEYVENKLNKNILNTAKHLNYKKPGPLKVNRFLKMNKLVAQFIGLYIAEGSVSSNGNSFNINLHSNETYGQKIARDFCLHIDIPFHEITQENKYQLSASSKIIATFLSRFLGKNAFYKNIPAILHSSPFICDIIHGIFYGDGSAVSSYSFSTSSERLRKNLTDLLMANNIFVNISIDERSDNYIIEVARSFNTRFYKLIKPWKYNSEVFISNGLRNNAIIEGENAFLVPIKDVKSYKHSGYVYNVEVQNDNSFTSFGMATHNCLPLLEALACEKLVIAPRHGGQLDFLNDDNSLLVDTKEMAAPFSMQYWTHQKEAVVGDPDTRHCSELLRRVYENPEEEKQRIVEPARETVRKFSWEAAAQMILDLPIPNRSRRLSEKRKVLYIVPYTMVGGGEVWIKEAISRLDRNIYDPHVAFVNGHTEAAVKLFENLNVTFEDLSDKGRQFALKCLVESENYSIVHFHNSFGVYHILRNAWKQGFRCRIVETVHSELAWNDSMVKVSARDKMVSLIVSVSETLGRKLVKMGNKHVAVLPQQVDWNRFKGYRSKEILDEHNIPKSFVVGFVGRLSPEKNVPVIVQCARSMPDTSFVIIGEGPQAGPLKHMASDLNNVFFLGNRTDVEKFYPAFDVLMLPSHMEGMPLVILEALTAGTPVVASDVGAISEVVKEGVNGYLSSKPDDYLIFITLLAKLKDKGKWEECSNNSKVISKSLEERAKSFDINNVYNMLFREVK